MSNNKDKFPGEPLAHIRMLDALDRIDGRLDNIEQVQVKQASDIEHHIQRTDLLQEQLDPIYKTYLQAMGVVKLVAAAATIFGIIEAIKSIW